MLEFRGQGSGFRVSPLDGGEDVLVVPVGRGVGGGVLHACLHVLVLAVGWLLVELAGAPRQVGGERAHDHHVVLQRGDEEIRVENLAERAAGKKYAKKCSIVFYFFLYFFFYF